MDQSLVDQFNQAYAKLEGALTDYGNAQTAKGVTASKLAAAQAADDAAAETVTGDKVIAAASLDDVQAALDALKASLG